MTNPIMLEGPAGRGMTLHCIPLNNQTESCPSDARWHVWYVGFGGIYTSSCDAHLAERLLDPANKIRQLTCLDFGPPITEQEFNARLKEHPGKES